MLIDLVAFSTARRFMGLLSWAGAAFAVLGLIAFWAGWHGTVRPPFAHGLSLHVPSALACFGVALWLGASGFLSCAVMAFGRVRLVEAEKALHSPRPPPRPAPAGAAAGAGSAQGPETRWTRLRALAVQRWRQVQPRPLDGDALTGWAQAAVAGALAALAVIAIILLGRRPPDEGVSIVAQRIYGGALIACAFPLLVAERSLAGIAAELLPEAAQINRIVRTPLAAALGLGGGLILSSLGFGWAAGMTPLISLLVLLVAAEIAARAVALFFIPFSTLQTRRAAADSRIAGALLRLKWPSLKTVNTAVSRQFGIDLSRSWALAFVRRAALPVLLGMALLAWCMTGVTALGVNQRGVYERLGEPAAIFGSGVHLHLPWPLGVIKPVENGVVHQLPIEFLLPNGGKAEGEAKEAPPRIVGAEDHPSEESDRLWTGDHPFEGSYLIASEENGRQSFQLVDTDMAVIYRVALSDEAARNAAYRLSDPDGLIQALSGQLLVRYFVQHQLLDVLGENRASFALQFQRDLQRQLDALSSGLEVLGVSIEAIHPPPGAAGAYHNVQAAEIAAKSAVFTEQAAATNAVATAKQAAIKAKNDALATAAETTAKARGDAAEFAGDRQAYTAGSAAFLFERRLAAVTGAMNASNSVFIVDHRLHGPDLPTVDMRPRLGAPAPSYDPPSPEPPTSGGSSSGEEGDDD